MKYLLKTLVIFIIIFLVLKLVLYLFDEGHTVSYSIGNFTISEELNTKDNNNYYFELTHEDFQINFQINNDYGKAEKVITNIEYQNVDGYDCILPIFKNGDILTDVMCLKDNEITYANDLDNSAIKDYLDTLDNGYNIDNYQDNASETKLSNTQTIYKDNFLENHYIAMETYKGLSLFGGNETTVQIFEEDVYTKPLSIFTDKYYIVADYTENYNFTYFYAVNIINGNIINIRSYDDISFDSYIAGAVGTDVYLFDKETNTQYKIDIEKESVEQFHDKDHLQTYNGTWEDISLSEALEGVTFNNYYTDEIDGYDKVDKVDNYYYLYEKDDNHYNVYRADVQNSNIRTYLFETTDIDSVIYLEDSVYYVNGNTLYYYYNFGNRKVITNTELEFNSDISFGVYKR